MSRDDCETLRIIIEVLDSNARCTFNQVGVCTGTSCPLISMVLGLKTLPEDVGMVSLFMIKLLKRESRFF